MQHGLNDLAKLGRIGLFRQFALACLCVTLLFICNAHAADPLIDQGEIVYIVKARDNLNTISEQLLDRTTRWDDVARRNKLRDAHLLRIGQKLLIPYAWLKNQATSAHFTVVLGEVRLDGRPAHVGDTFSSGAQIITGVGASAQLKLPDGSVIAIMEKSLIQATKIEKKPKGVFYNNAFYLDQGRIDAVKEKYADGQAPLSIQGKHATIGIRGTHFRIGQEGEKTLTEVEYGRVSCATEKIREVAKPAPELALGGGQGTVADGIHDAVAVQLLAQPDLSQLPTEFLPSAVHFTLPMLAGATGFRGELALDDQFKQILTFVQTDNHQITLSGLPDGRYYLRLRAVDAQGLQGLESHARLILKTPPYIPPPILVPLLDNDKVKIHWNGGVSD